MREKIKVAFFSCFYPDISGGAEFQAFTLASSLNREVYDPFFISLSEKRCGYAEEHGLRVYFFQKRKGPFGFDKGYLQNYRFIRDVLALERPNVVYQRMGNTATAVLAWLARRLGFRFIWACASVVDLAPGRLQLSRPHNVIGDLLRIYGIRRADVILAQTSDQQLILEKRFKVASTVLKNAHPPSHAAPVKAESPIVVIFVGNFKAVKQPEIFVELARCFLDVPNVCFKMIGRSTGGEYQRFIESRMVGLDNLEWLGEAPQTQVNALLSGAHVLVNTSQYEGFSNTFVQAWQRRVAVLSLSVDPDALLSGQGLGLVSNGDFLRLRENLRLLVEDASLRERIANDAERYADREHGLATAISKFETLLYSPT